jgi:hypothetical protein
MECIISICEFRNLFTGKSFKIPEGIAGMPGT